MIGPIAKSTSVLGSDIPSLRNAPITVRFSALGDKRYPEVNFVSTSG